MSPKRMTNLLDDRCVSREGSVVHASHHTPRMDHQLPCAIAIAIADKDKRRYANRADGLGRLRQACFVEPRRFAFHSRGFACQQVGYETLSLLDIGEYVTGRRIQQAGAEAQFA